jgi:hypothetical protein
LFGNGEVVFGSVGAIGGVKIRGHREG